MGLFPSANPIHSAQAKPIIHDGNYIPTWQKRKHEADQTFGPLKTWCMLNIVCYSLEKI
jgi:hypothetical protein